jgi:hypothetical protein
MGDRSFGLHPFGHPPFAWATDDVPVSEASTPSQAQVVHSVLSTLSAVGGFVALVTPPPVDMIALGVSVASGAGALAIEVANPEFRRGVGSLLRGRFDSRSLTAVLGGVATLVGAAPGLGGAAKALSPLRA